MAGMKPTRLLQSLFTMRLVCLNVSMLNELWDFIKYFYDNNYILLFS